jgi:hypothetical protein
MAEVQGMGAGRDGCVQPGAAPAIKATAAMMK